MKIDKQNGRRRGAEVGVRQSVFRSDKGAKEGRKLNAVSPRLNHTARPEGALFDPTAWKELIPAEEWLIYRRAIQVIRATGAGFLLGGAFGLAVYTGHWRNTKDIDFFVLPSDRDLIIQALGKAGFHDYYDTLPYDRGWIYRAIQEGVIVDIIWGMPNRRCEVDEVWFQNASRFKLRNELLGVIPAEELLWIKLYVMQRDRCDWPDLINLLFATGHVLDWRHLLERLDEDAPLLGAVLMVFGWLCPERARQFPKWVYDQLRLPLPSAGEWGAIIQRRVRLLDTRPWFSALQPSDQPMIF